MSPDSFQSELHRKEGRGPEGVEDKFRFVEECQILNNPFFFFVFELYCEHN